MIVQASVVLQATDFSVFVCDAMFLQTECVA